MAAVSTQSKRRREGKVEERKSGVREDTREK
jgi:hypothetical protein